MLRVQGSMEQTEYGIGSRMLNAGQRPHELVDTNALRNIRASKIVAVDFQSDTQYI